jgi:hypothetical protein
MSHCLFCGVERVQSGEGSCQDEKISEMGRRRGGRERTVGRPKLLSRPLQSTYISSSSTCSSASEGNAVKRRFVSNNPLLLASTLAGRTDKHSEQYILVVGGLPSRSSAVRGVVVDLSRRLLLISGSSLLVEEGLRAVVELVSTTYPPSTTVCVEFTSS